MIVNFSTKFDRLTMFGEPALALLGMLGHSTRVPGAMLASELPAALARLRAALQESGHVPSPTPSAEPDDPENGRPREWPVDLATRAVPLRARIDTFDELDYFRNGGILHYVLRGLARHAA